MEQNLFNGAGNLAIYQVISFILFFLVFIGVVIRIFRMDKNLVKKMAEIPLEKGNKENITKGEII